MILRICKARGCTTHLSIYNPGDRCWPHTPDATQQVITKRLPKRDVVSHRFSDGIRGTYELNRTERESYATWANEIAVEEIATEVEQMEGVEA